MVLMKQTVCLVIFFNVIRQGATADISQQISRSARYVVQYRHCRSSGRLTAVFAPCTRVSRRTSVGYTGHRCLLTGRRPRSLGTAAAVAARRHTTADARVPTAGVVHVGR